VYSLFALCEYFVIISNIAFHYVTFGLLDAFALTVVDVEGMKLG